MSESSMSNRFDIDLAGQKIPFSTSPENELKLREAASLLNQQLEMAMSGGNRSLERAALISALKLAGEVLDSRKKLQNVSEPSIPQDALENLVQKINAIETQVDVALQSLSLPGALRPIVP